MADSLYGYTDSFTTSGITMPLVALDYDKDFAVSHDGDAVVLSNITTPVDQPETMRFALYDVANVYKNTDIQPIHRENGVKGKKLVISVLDTARITLTGSNEVVDYPVKASINVEFPVSSNLTSANIYQVVRRCVAATQDYMKVASASSSGAVADATLLNQEFRGGLNPQDGKICTARTS